MLSAKGGCIEKQLREVVAACFICHEGQGGASCEQVSSQHTHSGKRHTSAPRPLWRTSSHIEGLRNHALHAAELGQPFPQPHQPALHSGTCCQQPSESRWCKFRVYGELRYRDPGGWGGLPSPELPAKEAQPGLQPVLANKPAASHTHIKGRQC